MAASIRNSINPRRCCSEWSCADTRTTAGTVLEWFEGGGDNGAQQRRILPKLSFKTLSFITSHSIAGVHLYNFTRCPLDIIAAMFNKVIYYQLELSDDD